MTFLNSMILAGLGFIAIPVILHFLLRQKPKKLIFPALRLIEIRRKQSVRRMRLRHFWLMLLRILALAAIVFALARPSLPPANYGLTGFEVWMVAGIVAAGIGCFLYLTRRAFQQHAPFVAQQHQDRYRVWSTVGTLVALALLVGWPYQRRIAAEITDPKPVRELNLPVAGIMVFDTSLSMSYLYEGKTSLERAQDVARAHLQTLSQGSRVAIAETSNDNPVLFQSTILSAQTRLDGLEPKPVAVKVEDRLRDALQTHQDDRERTLADQGNLAEEVRRDKYVRRIYLFTDLAQSAWREGVSTLLKGELEEFADINLYLIDVGQTEPQNMAITNLTLSRERIPLGGDLIVTATVQATARADNEQTLELLFVDNQGNVSKHGQTSVSLTSDSAVQVEFPVVTELRDAIVQGEVRFASNDNLAFDNIRYFSAEVSPPPKILVVAPTRNVANEWMTALAPHDKLNDAKNKFRPEYARIDELYQLELSQFSGITLINVPRLADEIWQQLGRYVENGGGLTIVLGSTEIHSPSYNRAQAQVFLPARLVAWQPENDWRFSIDERDHAMFWKFRQYENYGFFSLMENDVWVSRFWLTEPAEGSNVVATYNDTQQSPAMLERTHGRGRTVMLTTAADLPENQRQRWNNLPSPFVSPILVVFAEQTTEYVTRFTDLDHNYLAGDRPMVVVEPRPDEQEFLLKEPGLKQSRRSLPPGDTQVTFDNLTHFGHYELARRETLVPVGGFSINPLPAESNLTRLDQSALDDRLGENRYQLAASIDELKDDINASDLGQEVYPMLMMLVVLLFCGEHLVANRFYNSPAEQTSAKPPL